MMAKKLTLILSNEAHRVAADLAAGWGGISIVAALEMLLRRTGGLAPFDPEQKKAEVFVTPAAPLAAVENLEQVAVENHEQVSGPHLSREAPSHEQVSGEERLEEPVEVPVAQVEEEAPTNVAGGRVFVRNWYDDDAPEWVRLLGADATSGLDLTPAQAAALNDWQAGVERGAP